MTPGFIPFQEALRVRLARAMCDVRLVTDRPFDLLPTEVQQFWIGDAEAVLEAVFDRQPDHTYATDPRTQEVFEMLRAMESGARVGSIPVASEIHAGMIVAQVDNYAERQRLGIAP